MSSSLTAEIWAQPLSPKHKLYLLAVADNADHFGVVRGGIDITTLSVMTGYTPRNLRRLRADMEGAGVISRNGKDDAIGFATANWELLRENSQEEEVGDDVSSVTPTKTPAERINAVKRALQQKFLELYPAIKMPSAKASSIATLWYQPLYEMADIALFSEDRALSLLTKAAERMRGATVKAPISLMNAYRTVASEKMRQERGATTEWSPLGGLAKEEVGEWTQL